MQDSSCIKKCQLKSTEIRVQKYFPTLLLLAVPFLFFSRYAILNTREFKLRFFYLIKLTIGAIIVR